METGSCSAARGGGNRIIRKNNDEGTTLKRDARARELIIIDIGLYVNHRVAHFRINTRIYSRRDVAAR